MSLLKRLLKQILPTAALDRYYYLVSRAAALRYGFPSRKMIVIGVTGTNGKSTACAMIARLLEGAGHRVGMTTTVSFRVAGVERLNDTKMTMLGRFRLQKMLADMARAGCRYAVIETSSEGIKQHRHAGIDYDLAVFTNLTPEHIESHGGFENYKKAKGELFKSLVASAIKTIGGEPVKKTIIANLADPHGPYFLGFSANAKYGFLAGSPKENGAPQATPWPLAVVKALDVALSAEGSRFTVRGVPFALRLPGIYNIENALSAICVGLSQRVPLEVMSQELGQMAGVPGRFERIDEGQPFTAIVDYAPEPEALRQLYGAVDLLHPRRIIHVLGSCGGGRDVARRPVLGKMAAEKADIVIVTNEDPYDDDPLAIIAQVAEGARAAGKREGEDLFLIPDRREALAKAVALAGPGGLVLATGKGAEQAIMIADGKKMPWDEREELRKAIRAGKRSSGRGAKRSVVRAI